MDIIFYFKSMLEKNYKQKFVIQFDDDEFLQHHVAKLPCTLLTTIMD